MSKRRGEGRVVHERGIHMLQKKLRCAWAWPGSFTHSLLQSHFISTLGSMKNGEREKYGDDHFSDHYWLSQCRCCCFHFCPSAPPSSLPSIEDEVGMHPLCRLGNHPPCCCCCCQCVDISLASLQFQSRVHLVVDYSCTEEYARSQVKHIMHSLR